MNIYEMYKNNGFKFGFAVVRNTWGNTIAKIESIEGVEEGKPIVGKPPYYNNPKVMAKFYKRCEDENCSYFHYDNTSKLSCAGTFSYNMIEL